MARRLSDDLRARLKIPLGVLIPDGEVDRITVLGHVTGAPCVITVGDKTTERVVADLGIVADLQIVDGQERRVSRSLPPLPRGTIEVSCTNPAASITDESMDAIRTALSAHSDKGGGGEGRRPVRLTVMGEEDLLVIPACVNAPPGAAVLYGQPGEGMVIVRVDDGVRHKTQTLLEAIRGGDDETVAV